MGSIVNLSCEHCALVGNGVLAGVGMLPTWQFLEARIFYCGECKRLASATVLRRVSALRAELDAMDQRPWSTLALEDGRLAFKPSELAKLLMQVARRPRCTCGSQLRGSQSYLGEHTPCPKCTKPLQVQEVGDFD